MNKRSEWKVRALLALILSASGASLAVAQTAEKTADDEVKLEKFEVTGSRIKRIDAETPSPIVRITAASLEATGFTNLGDALRALPYNNSFAITPEGSSTGFGAGTSTINLRGLGNNNTLILINGRRATPAGVGSFNGFQSVVDINSIPSSAIESLEIVKDGASAIYGSDAVAGVVNIKMRQDYNGLGATVTFGNTLETDSFYRSAFIIAGASNAHTSITVTADMMRRNAIANRDLTFNKNDTADKRAVAGTSQVEISPDGLIYSGIDWRSSNSFPARFFIPGTNTLRSFSGPTNDPSAASALPISRATGVGYYDFQKVSWATPEEETMGFSAFARHEFTDTLYGFADLSFRRLNYRIAAAAAPFTTTDKGAGVNNRLVVPAASPYNPYGERYFPGAGQDILLSTYRLVMGGERFTEAVSDYPRLVAGLGGDISENWSWEGYYMWSQGSYANSSPGTAFDSRVQEALMGLTIDGQTLYANPFGPEDPRVTDYYIGNNPTKTTFTGETLSLGTSGSLFELAGGDLGLAAGIESRTEAIEDVRTLENESGNVVGGSEGFGYSGDRRVYSAYAELSIPVHRKVEFQLAARYEDYSDFGTTTKPKFAVKVQPTDWLLLRGSFSQSFKAPDLAFLLSKGSVSFTPSQLLDPKRPDTPATQIKTVGRGNADLKPEETDTFYVGAVIDFDKGPLKNFTFEVAGFRYDQKNLITRDSATFTLQNEDNLPAGRVVRQPLTAEEIAAGITTGRLDYIANDWFNSNKAKLEGMDFAVYYTIPWDRFGQFRVGAEATYYSRFEREDVDSQGNLSEVDIDDTYAFPPWRGNATVAWKLKDWSASVYVSYIGDYPNPDFPGINPFVTVNPQVSYAGLFGTKITVGARNVLNNHPPFDLSTGSDSYAAGVHSPEPTFVYVRLSKEF